jgi:hypothetical protein
VVVASNMIRTTLHGYQSAYPAVVMFADGSCAEHESDAGWHMDDWPSGVGNTVPGPGVWVWEGDLVWSGGQTQDGEEWDLNGEGAWRRPNAAEAWALMRGEAPWPGARTVIR